MRRLFLWKSVWKLWKFEKRGVLRQNGNLGPEEIFIFEYVHNHKEIMFRKNRAKGLCPGPVAGKMGETKEKGVDTMAEISVFGTMPDGRPVEQLTLRRGDMSCAVLTYGGTLRSLCVPDRAGMVRDVVLGFDTMEGYQNQTNYIGALVGRCANRIARGKFTLNGEEYTLAVNNGENHLHGGEMGFDKRLWTVERAGEDFVTLSLVSPHLEEGYPGTLRAEVTYTLTDGALVLDYRAESDRDTLCNLTNHAYFNLAGHGERPVTDHVLTLHADRYTPTDPGLIPLGPLAPVDGTPMDLRKGLTIGEGMASGFSQIAQAGGYDHNWAVNGPVGTLRPAAEALCPESGITLAVETTLPGLQIYVSDFTNGKELEGKGGAPYRGRNAFCMETQFYPDSPNHPDYPQALLRKGEVWEHRTVFRFGTKEG